MVWAKYNTILYYTILSYTIVHSLFEDLDPLGMRASTTRDPGFEDQAWASAVIGFK